MGRTDSGQDPYHGVIVSAYTTHTHVSMSHMCLCVHVRSDGEHITWHSRLQ